MFKNLRRSLLGFAVIASSVAVVPVASGMASAIAPSVSRASSNQPGVGASSVPTWTNTNVIAISAGNEHTCAIQGSSPTATSGSVFCWGKGGSLGDGTMSQSNVPVLVASNEGFTNTAVSMMEAGGDTTCAIEGGSLWCWGGVGGFGGQLGNGTTSRSPLPVKVAPNGSGADAFANNGNVTYVEASYAQTCAIESGKVFCWGWENDTLGLGGQSASPSSAVPNRVADSATPGFRAATATSVHMGTNWACAVAGGQLYCWGYDNYGNLGAGVNASSNRPRLVVDSTPGTEFTNASVSNTFIGNDHGCAIVSGTVSCWGRGTDGRLGSGATTNLSRPTAVQSGGGFGNNTSSVTSGAAAEKHTCAIESGRLFCWGLNSDGRLGNGSLTSSTTPVAVSPSSVYGFTNSGTGIGVVTAVTAGTSGGSAGHTCAIENKVAYCWGGFGSGQLGIGAQTGPGTNVPVKVFVVSAPAAPTISVSTGPSGTLSVSVTKPSDGGSNIVRYEYQVDSGTPVTESFNGMNSQTFNIANLTNGTSYSIKVRAVNGIGAGAWSAPASGTPSAGSGGSGGGSGGGIPSVIPLPASTWGADCSSATNKSFTGYATTPSNSFDFLLGGCMGTGTNVYIGIQSAGVGVQTNVSGTWGSTNPPTITSAMPTKNDLTSYQRTGSIMGIKLLFNAIGSHTVYVANDACYNSLAASTTPISSCPGTNMTTFTFTISAGGGSGGGSGGGGSPTCTAGAENIVGTSPGVDTTFGGGWQEIAPPAATEGSFGGIVKTSDNALLVINGVAAPSGGTVQLRKFDLNGSPVAGFGQSGVLDVDVSSAAESWVSVRGVSVGPDGDVTVNGVYRVGANVTQNYFVLKLTASGAVDTSFDPAGVAGVLDFQNTTTVMRTATLKNGAVLIVQSNPNGIKKYDATGAAVAGFAGSGMISLVSSSVLFAPTNDGGFFTQTATGDVVVSRYDGSGVLTSWAGAGTKTLGDPSASDVTGGLKLTSTGLLVAYGTSTSSGGTPAYNWKVTKLDATTGAEATFGTGGTMATTWSLGRATGIDELSDGSIVVSGVLYDSFGPTAAMIKVSSAGEIAPAFSAGPGALLHGSCSLSLGSGGTISYGGIVPVADGKFVALMSKFDPSLMSSQVVKATLVRLDFGLSGSGGGSGGGSAPTLVTSANQSSLERDPGSEGMIINGQPVTIETTRVEISAARTPASQRTPAQVAAIQAAGQALLQEYLASLPAGAVTNVAVVNTTTGAVMRNLVFDADGNSLDVPVEDIVILDGPAISLMIGSNNANITSDGKYQVGAGGIIGVVGSGLGASAAGELVVMSTPTLIGNFTTSATGDVSESAQLPNSIGVGDHTLVVATGTTYAVMGLRVVPSSLPTTGLTEGSGRTMVIALFTLVFAAVLVRSRRLTLLAR